MSSTTEAKDAEAKYSRETEESDLLATYLKQISHYPLLTRKDEMEIGSFVSKLKKQQEEATAEVDNGSISRDNYEKKMNTAEKELESIRNLMITSNLRLVVAIAKRYRNHDMDMLDLINEGNIGLINAVERFDYSRGYKFSTYGTWWIQQSIIKALADKSRAIRVPIHMLNVYRNSTSAGQVLAQKMERPPSLQEVADYLKLSPSRLDSILQLTGDIASLDTSVDGESNTMVSELISSDDEKEDPGEISFRTNIQKLIDDSLNNLTDREKNIIELRYGLRGEGPLSLVEIGDRIGVTRERVRQIQNKAISTLRENTELQGVKKFL